MSASNAPLSYETRPEIEAAAKAADAAGRKSEASLLRARLQRGDFQEGDRVVVALENNPRIDTLQVRTGRVLQLVGMGDVPLDGVLRSELSDHITKHLSRYLKNPGVRATPLLPISVLGNVGLPGFYYTTADVTLRDMIMRAGGPRDGDVNRIVVRRSGEVIWAPADTRVALTDGMSLDRLHLRAGDEIVVPGQRRFGWAMAMSIVTATTTLALVLLRH